MRSLRRGGCMHGYDLDLRVFPESIPGLDLGMDERAQHSTCGSVLAYTHMCNMVSLGFRV